MRKLRKACGILVYDRWLFFRKIFAGIKRHLVTPVSGRISVNGVIFDLEVDADPYMPGIFLGAYQNEVLSVIRRYVHAGGVFVDIGANIGYISAFALGQVGVHGQVHAFEPSPRCFKALQNLPKLNPAYQLRANQLACGASNSRGIIMEATSRNRGANTMIEGILPPGMIECSTAVEVASLGEYLLRENCAPIQLIKIDTEGYEYPVLVGLEVYWQQTGLRPPILVEIAPCAYPRVGATLEDLAALVRRYGYESRDPVFRRRTVAIENLVHTTDVLLVASRAGA